MMYNNVFGLGGGMMGQYGPFWGQFSWLLPILPVFLLWSLVWKGLALWKAGRNNQLGWFVALLVVNTLGLLEIFYLLVYHYKPRRRK